MKNLRFVSAMALALSLFMIEGCSGGGISTYGASNAQNMFTIVTTVTQGIEPAESWPDVIITGYAWPGSYSCDVSEDAGCIVEIGYNPLTDELDPGAIPSFNTGSSGEAYFGTDAYDGKWNFDANTDPNDVGVETCSASVTISDYYATNGYVPLVCGQNDATMDATPSSCTVDHSVKPPTNNCPTSVTLSFPPPLSSSPTLPVGMALTAANYDNSSDNLAQSSVETDSTTSIVVPAPTTYGTTYLVVLNASGNLIGAAEFTINYIPPTLPPPGCRSGSPCTDLVSAGSN